MDLILTKERRIYAYNKEQTTPLDDYIVVKYDGEFDFFYGEDKEGYRKVFYLEDDDKTIRIEHIPVQDEDPVMPEEGLGSVMGKLEVIEEKIQTNEDLQTFYDEIVKEVGL